MQVYLGLCGDSKSFVSQVGHLYALISNTVELTPTLGVLFPRGGPVQDPVLIRPQP